MATCMSHGDIATKFRVVRRQPPLRQEIGVQRVFRRKGMQGSMPFLFCALYTSIRLETKGRDREYAFPLS